MDKTILIKQNSHEVREKLRQAGYTLCACASFNDAIWLSYYNEVHPNGTHIHGEGYSIHKEEGGIPPLERIENRLRKGRYYDRDKELFESVEEFLEKYPHP